MKDPYIEMDINPCLCLFNFNEIIKYKLINFQLNDWKLHMLILISILKLYIKKFNH